MLQMHAHAVLLMLASVFYWVSGSLSVHCLTCAIFLIGFCAVPTRPHRSDAGIC